MNVYALTSRWGPPALGDCCLLCERPLDQCRCPRDKEYLSLQEITCPAIIIEAIAPTVYYTVVGGSRYRWAEGDLLTLPFLDQRPFSQESQRLALRSAMGRELYATGLFRSIYIGVGDPYWLPVHFKLTYNRGRWATGELVEGVLTYPRFDGG